MVAAENDDAGDAPFPQFGGGDQGVAAVVAGSGDGEDFWVWFFVGIFVEAGEAGEAEAGAFGDANSGAAHHFARRHQAKHFRLQGADAGNEMQGGGGGGFAWSDEISEKYFHPRPDAMKRLRRWR